MAQQQADALALLAEAALDHGLDPGAPGERYQVVVHVDAAALADPEQPGQSVLEDGARVPAETSQRLACDASRVVMRHDEDGRTVEVGARTRTIPPALRRALHHRDQAALPGALPFGRASPPSWRRATDTLWTSRCSVPAHRAYTRRLSVDRQPTARFSSGDRTEAAPDVPARPRAADPSSAPRTARGAGARCTRGRRPVLAGERLDLGYALDVLHRWPTHPGSPARGQPPRRNDRLRRQTAA